MKRIIKAGFMMLLGVAIWTNGGDLKQVSAEPWGNGICKAGWLVSYEGDFTYCVLPSGSCRYSPGAGLPACAQNQPTTNTRPVPPKPSSYGAVAWDVKKGFIGSSKGQTTEQNAVDAALQKCGTPNCKVTASYSNQCIAMSYGLQKNNAYYWQTAVGLTSKKAEKSALLDCKKAASNCQIYISECSLP